MSTSITVYQSEHTLRVVAGEHKPHEGARAARVRVYPSAKLAYAAETTNEVRSAILRIDPTAAPEPGDGPLGPIAPVTIPAGALARPAASKAEARRREFARQPVERLTPSREVPDPDAIDGVDDPNEPDTLPDSERDCGDAGEWDNPTREWARR